MKQERVIKLRNFTADHLLLMEYLSQFEKNQLPQFIKVSQGRGEMFVTMWLSLNQFNEIKEYIKNNQ